MADTIQLRRDTAANWVTANPVLADGEIGIETDTRKRKCGNGTTAWNSLSYMFSDDLDAEPTANSHKPVESGGTKAAIDIAAEIGLAALDAIGDADSVPTEESTELVRSGGVWEAIRNNGKGAFDISAYKAVDGVLAKYDDLAQALGTNGANVPAAARKPGMSVCFVLNSDNKYVRYNYLLSSITDANIANVNNWQGVDEEPVAKSKNLVKSGGVHECVRNNNLKIPFTKLNIANLTLYDYEILSDGKYGTQTNVSHYAIKVSEGEHYLIKTTYNSNFKYAFATSNAYAAGEDIPLVSGTSVFENAQYEKFVITIPSTCSYLLISRMGDTKVYLISEMLTNIDAIESIMCNNIERIDLNDYEYEHKVIGSNNTWVTSGRYWGVFVPVSPGEVYYIKANDSYQTICAVLSSNDTDYVHFAGEATQRKEIPVGKDDYIVIPQNGVYLYFTAIVDLSYYYAPEDIIKLSDNTFFNTFFVDLFNLKDEEKAIYNVVFGDSPFVYTLNQGYYEVIHGGQVRQQSDNLTRVRIGSFGQLIKGAYHLKLNSGYLIRAIAICDNSGYQAQTIVNASQLLAEYTFIPTSDSVIYSAITLCKTDASSNISPEEDIIDFLVPLNQGLVKDVEDIKKGIPSVAAFNKAVFMGDSITHGVFSFWGDGIKDDDHRYNGFELNANFASQTNEQIITAATAYHGIPYYFGLFACCETVNLARRGSGFVVDGRSGGNFLDLIEGNPNKTLGGITAYDFSDVDIVVVCLGINDYIQGANIGNLSDFISQGNYTRNTVIGNLVIGIKSILNQNPLCKIVVFTPYNSWGQVSKGDTSEGGYIADPAVLYGNESTNYALGSGAAGSSLQTYIDAIDTVCNYYGIQHVPLSKSNVCNNITLKNIMIDGLHPSKESYIKLAAEIYGKCNFGV